MKLRFRLLALLLALVLVAPGLVSCGPTAAPAAPTEAQAPTEAAVAPTQAPAPTEASAPSAEPAAKKVATFIYTQEFDTLNPAYSNMWFSQTTFELWNCSPWLFDDQAAAFPWMLKELPSTANGGISADGKVITMRLLDGMVWSDGTPLTSQDFVFTYEMYVNPANAVATTSPYDQMEKVEGPDPSTVVMTFKEPYAAWLSNLMWRGILPAHVLRPVFEQDGTIDQADWNKNPTVGCGPYTFEEWESGSFARLAANDKFWLGRPKIDEIFIRFVPDDASQIAALKTGDGDLGTFVAYSDIPALQEASIAVIPAMSGYNEGIYFAVGEKTHPALKELNVRKAIALATDRASLVNDLLLGLTAPAATDWDLTPWNDPSIQPWPYDPEQAKALLDEAGWVDSNGDGTRDKDGVELVIRYGTTTREIRRDTQAVLQEQLAAVGIGTELLNYESDLFFAGYSEGGPAAVGELDMFEYSTQFRFPDPDTADWLCSEIPGDENPQGTNWQANCDPDLDALFLEQLTQVDPAERQKTFHEITKMIFDKVYWLGLWQDPDIWAVGERLQNVKISGATPYYNIMEWDLAQ